jgi:hypothetical protein
MHPTARQGSHTQRPLSNKNQVVAARSSMSQQHRHSLLGTDSMLRKLGFFGHFVIVRQGHESKQVKRIGFCSPPWLFSLITSLEIEITKMSTKCSRSLWCSWRLIVQNRVSKDSQFMLDCRKGDLERIKQSLRDGTGSVYDRTFCRGQTPLLVRVIPSISAISTCRLKGSLASN